MDHLARLLASARIQRPIRRPNGHRQRMGGYGRRWRGFGSPPPRHQDHHLQLAMSENSRRSQNHHPHDVRLPTWQRHLPSKFKYTKKWRVNCVLIWCVYHLARGIAEAQWWSNQTTSTKTTQSTLLINRLGIAKRIANWFRSASPAGETVRWVNFYTFLFSRVPLLSNWFVHAGCARKGIPGVYARVTSFLSWIKKEMMPMKSKLKKN